MPGINSKKSTQNVSNKKRVWGTDHDELMDEPRDRRVSEVLRIIKERCFHQKIVILAKFFTYPALTREFVIVENTRLVCLLDLTPYLGVTTKRWFKLQISAGREREKLDLLVSVRSNPAEHRPPFFLLTISWRMFSTGINSLALTMIYETTTSMTRVHSRS